jgi:hypothetical protein
VTPQTERAEAAASPKAPPRAPQPLVSAPPARRKGTGAGVLVGIGLAASLGLGAIVAAGWYLLGRRGPTTDTPAVSEETQAASAPAPVEQRGAVTAAVPATSAPAAESNPGSVAAAPASAPTPTAVPARVASSARVQPPSTTPPAPPVAPTQQVPAASDAAGDYAHLDELPPDTPDGRAAGEALAEKYRSGGSTGYTSTRFRARPRFPPGTTLAERPAIGTLVHLHQAEEAYHRKNGRYGSPRELAEAGFLRLDVPVSPQGFRRAFYAFRVTASADGYRADAVPLGGHGRAFMVDDSGFVRLPE